MTEKSVIKKKGVKGGARRLVYLRLPGVAHFQAPVKRLSIRTKQTRLDNVESCYRACFSLCSMYSPVKTRSMLFRLQTNLAPIVLSLRPILCTFL